MNNTILKRYRFLKHCLFTAALIVFVMFSPDAAVAIQTIGNQPATDDRPSANDEPFVVVLGIAQDGGYPQAGCQKDCCRDLEDVHEGPACLAVVDPKSRQRWLFECTPDFPSQLKHLNEQFPVEANPGLDGIFLTHAHMGHYSGLIHLGREAMGTRNVPVHAMPRMGEFLRNNGPWSQLVTLENIQLQPLESGRPVTLNDRIMVTPLTVPHRDEFSETVAFRIEGPNQSVLFLPDIDKWSHWETRIEDAVADVDVAFLDATFYDDRELPGRNMAEIPHPFIVESVKRFAALPAEQRQKIRFIHLNHTNPALIPGSRAGAEIRKAGMSIAETGQRCGL